MSSLALAWTHLSSKVVEVLPVHLTDNGLKKCHESRVLHCIQYAMEPGGGLY